MVACWRRGGALLLASACVQVEPARHAEPASNAAAELAWLEEPLSVEGGSPSTGRNALGPDPPKPPAPTVIVDDAGDAPRRQLRYEHGSARVERFVVTLTAEGSGDTELVPARLYQVAPFVAHVTVSSRALNSREGSRAFHTWELLSVEGEAPRGIPDQLQVGVDELGTLYRGPQQEYSPQDERAMLVTHATIRCLRALVLPLPAEAVGQNASWNGGGAVNAWGLAGRSTAGYRLQSLGARRAAVVASGRIVAERLPSLPPPRMAEGESYDVSQTTTFTSEAAVQLDSPLAEGRRTEVVVVHGVKLRNGAHVRFDSRFTLECRVRREAH
jgi:hypothetical protein